MLSVITWTFTGIRRKFANIIRSRLISFFSKEIRALVVKEVQLGFSVRLDSLILLIPVYKSQQHFHPVILLLLPQPVTVSAKKLLSFNLEDLWSLKL